MLGPVDQFSRTPVKVATAGAVAVFAVLLVLLFRLQVVQHAHFTRLSENNYIVEASIRAPRGDIVDCNGVLLGGSRQAFSICAIPRTILRNRREIAVLAQILGVGRDTVLERLEPTASSYRPTAIVRDADFSTLSRVEERFADLPDVIVLAEPVRKYPLGEVFSHLIGYVGEATQAEIVAGPGTYSSGDYIGKAGIEKTYEARLRGSDGRRLVQFSPSGEAGPVEVTDLPSTHPEKGSSLVLHADAGLQCTAHSALAGRRGCVIAMDVRSGGILALASSPSVDPNMLVRGVSIDDWAGIVGSRGKPLLNRAIQSSYPPGSTYKLVTAAAALEGEVASPRTTFKPCTGSYRFGNRSFGCWKKDGHGRTSMVEAITVSCDVYFYQLGERIGLDRFSEFAGIWALAELTGIDLPGEIGGLVPDSGYYDRVYGEGEWSRGVMLNLAIGQGEILLTPLEILCFVSGVANGGGYHRPRCVRAVVSGGGVEPVRSDAVRLDIAEGNLEILRQAMREVVGAEHGTGRAAALPGIEVCGKTGTAQNPHGDDHAWFVCFAPYQEPEIAVCVMVENGGHGSSVAAPVARDVLAHYFGLSDTLSTAGLQ
jgi:penicillin-binding protein 2